MDNKLKFVTGKTAAVFAKALRQTDEDELPRDVAEHAADQMEFYSSTDGEYFSNIIKYPHFTLQQQDDIAYYCFGIDMSRSPLL
ncbi:hypothetical protein DYU11_20095 [Fibrisoma montanum]|uniref:Uncharacterized protein n=1 Tax=Fibrisoma montanum TaxID=2305895 RepID=A0A418M3F6_9BACT|nr:hypothetical protein [Fibrisoma montanum]RIV20355.1 hypothetical protein DYU11_20095 [Fibrisoma montanum]